MIEYNKHVPYISEADFKSVDPHDIRRYECVFMIEGTDVWYARSLPKEITGYKEVGSVKIPTNNFDVVFMSYDEPNADANYQRLLTKVPNAKRVHGVKGILQAHQAAAKAATTYAFYVVDGDAWITDDFNFDFEVPLFDQKDVLSYVHLWNSENPVNGLKYGYGGVKLFNRQAVLDKTEWSTDFTTSFGLVMHDEVSNITAYNTDPYQTWKAAFRECAKLASGQMGGSDNEERLHIWTTVGDSWSIIGALAGKKYGETFYNNIEELSKINDFDWLSQCFGVEE